MELRELPQAERQPIHPIIEPRDTNQHWWERNGTFNPGVAEYKDHVMLLYRAYDEFRISRLGLAVSKDGINFQRFDHPAIDTQPADTDERLGIEDPRVTKIDDTYYIVHTAAAYHRVGTTSDISGVMDHIPWRVRVAMHSTRDFKRYVHHDVILPDVPAKNGCLLPEKLGKDFLLYYRQYQQLKCSRTADFRNWSRAQDIVWPPSLVTRASKIGIGAPPLRTRDGYLAIYHTVDDAAVYRLGLMLFNAHDPTRIEWYSAPILEPTMPYERAGYVPNVVYSCGSLIRNEELWIYYGSADRVIGRAVLPLNGTVRL